MLMWIVGIVSSLGLVGAIAAAIVVPGVAIPILSKIVGAVLKCKPCMALLAAIALLFVGALYGVHVEKARCETRMERARQAAAAAAKQRDGGIKADLEKTYQPQISALEGRAKLLQGEVEKYANSKPATPSDSCALGLEPLRLRKLQGS